MCDIQNLSDTTLFLVYMNYIVFGGSKGIGLSIVEGLMSQGHSVWSVSRSGQAPMGVEGISWDATTDDTLMGLPDLIH
ncbi:MAG: hypothetical protein EBQ97_05555, partial [Bacteroidetes bacterium]|nr:hypothetical protein [Bacteroidota bacterium]